MPSKKSDWQEPTPKQIREHRTIYAGYRQSEKQAAVGHKDYRNQPSRNRNAPSPAAKVDTCRRGHAFTAANTIQKKEGGRKCRTCFNAAARARKAGG